ncbi:hypothetical protein I7I50_12648 [Histoplasma capsulatum G186AR]|uniref:Uncharacterized protein n=1 Tax=Ajellomyces capsulatus TaxID=5037 RepID=A0A8H7Y9R4_AJECA|nr:hypothetical protein I7I52_11047 [Histoplasma capsulatum]QSS70873.1 hypothetical protein I7I50_12648 [Histoplasma capsulatum G186AR]
MGDSKQFLVCCRRKLTLAHPHPTHLQNIKDSSSKLVSHQVTPCSSRIMVNTISVIFSGAKEADRALPAAKQAKPNNQPHKHPRPYRPSNIQDSLVMFNALLLKSQKRPSTQLLRSPGWWAGVGTSADA